MSGESKAVFLSYASEDGRAAQRIAAALRAAGVETWLDKSELRGGDAWDRQIRERIHACSLFIALISAHTEARQEGYFRREWKLAVDRTRDMSENRTFIVPVAIDNTSERGAAVPDGFHAVQWTRLRGGRTAAEFVAHIQKLLAPAAAAPARRAALASPQEAQPPAPTPRSLRWRLPAALTGAVLLVCVAAWLLVARPWRVNAPAPQPGVSATATSMVRPAAAARQSIAVLPFLNLSADPAQDYFADGLAEELLELLTKTPGLHVIARTSSFSFKGKSEDIASIAAKLNVANILEGSVRKSKNRLRVSAQLIRADTSEHLWAETFERELTDVFKVQDEIAGAVVAALKIRLLPSQQPSPRSELRTTSLEAYDLYLQGRESYNGGDARGFERAVRVLKEATALDPSYAAAYAALALAEFWAEDSRTGVRAGGYDSSLVAAEKAVALAPEEAVTLSARGFLRAILRFDFAGAQSDLNRAVALNPGDANVLHRSAVVLAVVGDLPGAIDREQKALALDPLSTEICMRLAFFYAAAQRSQEARTLYQRALAIAPSSIRARYNLGDLELLEHRPEAALADYRQTELESFRLTGQARAEYSLGHLQASEQNLQKLLAVGNPYHVAEVYAWRGEKDKAFEWLNRTYAERDPALTWIKIDRNFSGLRDDARYQDLLRKLGLPQ